MEVPSFFNKADFYGTLLPGYLLVISYLLLYRPELLLGVKAPSFDLLSTVVFLVAGPIVGSTLKITHHILYRNIFVRGYSRFRDSSTVSPIESYYLARLMATDSQRFELDLRTADYDFDVSSAIGLIGLGTSYIYFHGAQITSALMLVAGFIFIIGAFGARRDRTYLTIALQDKYRPDIQRITRQLQAEEKRRWRQ